MSFAFGALLKAGVSAGLRPHEIWHMTPAELEMILTPSAAPRPLGRDRLSELESLFPDIVGD